MGDMTEQELRYMEDEVLVAAAAKRKRLLELHTALRHAAHHGHLTAIAKSLEVDGVDVNDRDGSGWSSLAWACKMGQLDAARLLLRNGADINLVDRVRRITQYASMFCTEYFFLMR